MRRCIKITDSEGTLRSILNKAATLLALYIGIMAMYAGGRVITGQIPKWPVIGWVPIYNFAVGVITVVITTVLIWKGNKFALPVAIATLTGHSSSCSFYRRSIGPS